MKSVYERTKLIITEFDTDDVIATSEGPAEPATLPPTDPPVVLSQVENAYGSYSSFKGLSNWF